MRVDEVWAQDQLAIDVDLFEQEFVARARDLELPGLGKKRSAAFAVGNFLLVGAVVGLTRNGNDLESPGGSTFGHDPLGQLRTAVMNHAEFKEANAQNHLLGFFALVFTNTGKLNLDPIRLLDDAGLFDTNPVETIAKHLDGSIQRIFQRVVQLRIDVLLRIAFFCIRTDVFLDLLLIYRHDKADAALQIQAETNFIFPWNHARQR